jgi:hypothetical protein
MSDLEGGSNIFVSSSDFDDDELDLALNTGVPKKEDESRTPLFIGGF